MSGEDGGDTGQPNGELSPTRLPDRASGHLHEERSDCDECAAHPPPLTGVVDFNAPGERLTLYRGVLISPSGESTRSTAPGEITLDWKQSGRLRWRAELDELQRRSPRSVYDWQVDVDDRSDRPLGFRMGGTATELPVHVSGEGRGWTNGGLVGEVTRPVRRAVAHWMNLPALGGTYLHHHTDQGWRSWAGRAEFDVEGWHLTFDERPDLFEKFRTTRDEESWVMTHVMALERQDEQPFLAADASVMLAAVQFAFSFALGYWTAPAALTGLHPGTREAVWAEWRPMFLNPPDGGSGWWCRHQVDPDLKSFLRVFASAWLRASDRLWMTQTVATAVSAVRVGFTEQRLTSVMSVLEMLSWLAEVRDGNRPEHNWGEEALHVRINMMLTAAKIEPKISSRISPSLRAFARKRNHANGPQALAELRNLVTHPKDNTDLYEDSRTLGEASRLALLYLELIVLHRLGYDDEYENHTDTAAWRGASARVPWSER